VFRVGLFEEAASSEAVQQQIRTQNSQQHSCFMRSYCNLLVDVIQSICTQQQQQHNLSQTENQNTATYKRNTQCKLIDETSQLGHQPDAASWRSLAWW
jgi:hypothetical protein